MFIFYCRFICKIQLHHSINWISIEFRAETKEWLQNFHYLLESVRRTILVLRDVCIIMVRTWQKFLVKTMFDFQFIMSWMLLICFVHFGQKFFIPLEKKREINWGKFVENRGKHQKNKANKTIKKYKRQSKQNENEFFRKQ